MSETTNYTCRMDSNVKSRCEALYAELGMNLSTAINVFLRESLRVGGFPFEVRIKQSNQTTLAAMQEAQKAASDPSYGHYSDAEELLEDLK